MLVPLSEAEDWPLWRAARLAAITDSPDAFPGAAIEWESGGERRWRERLLDASALKIVAVIDDAPAGLVRAVVDEGAVWLHSLWVSPALRGHGLGDQLISAVEEWAGRSADVVRLEVVPTNEPAIALYRRHGYAVTDEIGGELDDGSHELVMQRTLGEPVSSTS